MKAFIWDTETTGLVRNRTLPLDKQPEVIEFFGQITDLKTGKKIKEYETLIKPKNFPMSEETIKETKTKLTNAMLAKAPRFDKVAKVIKAHLQDAPVLIAHNLSFDQAMIEIELERMGEKIEWPTGLCTVEQTIHIKGYRLNLTNLHKHLFDGKAFDDAHRARSDVEALSRCAVELFKQGYL